jgi:hypothetical protein
MSNNSVENIRKLLDVIDLKRRDLSKYYSELRTCKLHLSELLDKNDKYRKDIYNVNQVLFQKSNIEIIDANIKYKDVKTKYEKTKQTLDHLESVIGNYNINSLITDIKDNFDNERIDI